MNVIIAEEQEQITGIVSRMLKKYDSNIKVVKVLKSVKEVVKYYKSKPSVDLAFLDTKLTDGDSFEIFDRIDVGTPIIFTTNSKDHVLKAFKLNSVDYILKPVNYNELVNAIEKFKKHWNTKLSTGQALFYKKRFVVKFGDHIQIKKPDEIVFFYAEGKSVYLFSETNNRKYLVEHTLDELENTLLNPINFFRINRQFIVNINFIDDVRNYRNRRLKITLNTPSESELIVSRERVNDFKTWLNQ